MSEIIFEKLYNTASELLTEDEKIVYQNVWFNNSNPDVPKYMLVGISYTDAKSYDNLTQSFSDQGYFEVMPYGELAYYFKTLKGGTFTNDEVDEVMRFYIANDSWPE